MRFAISAVLLTVLAAGPVMADGNPGPRPGGGGGGGGGGTGGGGSIKLAYIRVTNLCDDAVLVSAGAYAAEALEPNTSTSFGFPVSGGTPVDVGITASLASDPTTSTTHACSIQGGKTTNASVTRTTTAGAVSLQIECEGSTRTAALTRDAAVTLASGSGLGFLMLLGMLLGRAPVSLRREPGTEEDPVPRGATSWEPSREICRLTVCPGSAVSTGEPSD